MQTWREAYDAAHRADDHETMNRLDEAYDAALDAASIDDDDETIAARAVLIYQEGRA